MASITITRRFLGDKIKILLSVQPGNVLLKKDGYEVSSARRADLAEKA